MSKYLENRLINCKLTDFIEYLKEIDKTYKNAMIKGVIPTSDFNRSTLTANPGLLIQSQQEVEQDIKKLGI